MTGDPSLPCRDVVLREGAESIPAVLVTDAPPRLVHAAEFTWGPQRRALASLRQAVGQYVEHGHWDWTNKLSPATAGMWKFACVLTGTEAQGLMATRIKHRPGRLAGGRPVLYVDFLEVAPWNSRDLMFPLSPRFSGVGTVLLTQAVRASDEAGLAGRVGLSALPQAVEFYKARGMTLVDANTSRCTCDP